ncbi:MAG: hypothetical protein Q4F05_16760 [bacterium]|nr:hypothetical protein [bacterium]
MKYFKKDGKWRPRSIIAGFVGLSFFLSIIYVLIRLFIAPNTPTDNLPFQKLRSDYALMLLQCMLGLFMLYLPHLLERKWKVLFPDFMYILFFIFLFCAIYLGEVRSFYYTVPNWDTILHAISAAALATLGFNIVSLFNDAKKISMQMSPFFVSFFAFCFAVCAGSLWEIYEFTFDGILGFNMQKYATLTGVDLLGRAALMDTMKDIIVDSVSAFAISMLGYCQLKVVTIHGKKLKLPNMEVARIMDDSEVDPAAKSEEFKQEEITKDVNTTAETVVHEH